MNRYYYHSLRGFANEYHIYVVNDDVTEAKLHSRYGDALERISRDHAIYYGMTLPKKARKVGIQCYGSFCLSEDHPTERTREDHIASAIQGTKDWLVELDKDEEYLDAMSDRYEREYGV